MGIRRTPPSSQPVAPPRGARSPLRWWWLSRAAAVALWTLVVGSVVLAAAAVVRAGGEDAGGRPAASLERPRWDMAGFAELFVTAAVQSGEGNEDALAPFIGGAPVGLRGQVAGEWFVSSTAVIDVERVSQARWIVHVAADLLRQNVEAATYAPAGVRTFAVEVIETESGLSAPALPALVPDPVPGGELDDGWQPGSPPPPGDRLADTVQRFLAALLTGTGELDRWAAPGSELRAAPVTFDTVTVESWHVRDRDAGRRVRAYVRGESAGASLWLTYTLDLIERDGRWEVTAIVPTPVDQVSPGGPASTAIPAPHSQP
jgi:hypothetical protein